MYTEIIGIELKRLYDIQYFVIGNVITSNDSTILMRIVLEKKEEETDDLFI